MLTDVWFTFFIISHYFNSCDALGSCFKQKRGINMIDETSSAREVSQEPESPYLDDCMDGTHMKIGYYSSRSLKDEAGLPVSSPCLRCGACIAIAEKLNETLTVAHVNAHWLRRLDDEYVTELLRSLCFNGFEKYGLYEIAGYNIISEAILFSRYVPSELDGLWTKKLKELCHYYLDEYGEVKLYDIWLQDEIYPARDMVNKLCRSDRVFRDCLNIGELILNTFSSEKKNIRVVCP